MKTMKPMSVPRFAWIGCKATNAAALFAALIFRMPLLILVPLVTHGISALFGPRRAPLLVLYTWLDRFFNTRKEMVDEHALRFAHTVSSVFALLALIMLRVYAPFSWGIVLFLAIATTLGALGFCTATKLYSCAMNGTCCVRKK
jgi:hypothetical protein